MLSQMNKLITIPFQRIPGIALIIIIFTSRRSRKACNIKLTIISFHVLLLAWGSGGWGVGSWGYSL